MLMCPLTTNILVSQMDVFNTFIELLHQTGNVSKGQVDINESGQVTNCIVGAFSVLKELVLVLPNCLAEHISALVSGIEKALTDKSSTSNLKIEALVFTRLVMASHSPSVFHPYIKVDTSTKLSLDTFASHLRVQLGAAAMDHVLKKSLDFLITISLKLSLKCLLDARLLEMEKD
ncbi:hypothetical protein ZIOFF_029879 [Zingiber officinale]|uniref:Uncharacterized protein n=1 Tax=Zingiber officinale TaxID=94328 RepID=A0A8J5GNF5_ZINOF|nr:hypothetical protein ZIOFF_029879 [Zingiber officinale]